MRVRPVKGHAARERPYVFGSVARIGMARVALLLPGGGPEREPVHHILQHLWLSVLSVQDIAVCQRCHKTVICILYTHSVRRRQEKSAQGA